MNSGDMIFIPSLDINKASLHFKNWLNIFVSHKYQPSYWTILTPCLGLLTSCYWFRPLNIQFQNYMQTRFTTTDRI